VYITIKPRGVRRVGHAAYKREVKNTKVFVGRTEEGKR
jgi:hypothetical protein